MRTLDGMASTLTDHLRDLEAFLRREGDAPEWTGILIIEDTEITHGPRTKIPRSSLLTPNDFASRFDKLVARGYGWMNLVGNGVLDRKLIVSLEIPRESSDLPASKVPVIVAGPNFDSSGRKIWDLSDRVELI